jgi:drug/metabolite transporter (DMT)-like permease
MFLVFASAGLTICLFGLTPATTHIAVLQIDGLTVGMLRTVGAGIVALPLVLLLRLRPPRELGQWGLLILSALGCFVSFPLLFSLGSQSTSATHAALIMAALPLFTGLFGIAVDWRLPRAAWFIGAAIAVAGEVSLIAMQDGGSTAGATVAGDLLVLAACFLWAIGAVAGARLTVHVTPWAATFWAIVVASLCLAPIAVADVNAVQWSAIPPLTWAALLHVTVGASILAYVAWFWALARGGVTRIAPLMFIQPVIAVLFAALFVSERLSLQLLAAASAIVAGVVIACRGASAPEPQDKAERTDARSLVPDLIASFNDRWRSWRQQRRALSNFHSSATAT